MEFTPRRHDKAETSASQCTMTVEKGNRCLKRPGEQPGEQPVVDQAPDFGEVGPHFSAKSGHTSAAGFGQP
jgi:hypothetical protein